MSLVSMNPATGAQIKSYEAMSSSQVDEIIAKTHNAHLEWRNTSFSHRANLMAKAATVLRNNSDEYAKLMTQDDMILGGHILGVNAGELIASIILAMRNKLPLSSYRM